MVFARYLHGVGSGTHEEVGDLFALEWQAARGSGAVGMDVKVGLEKHYELSGFVQQPKCPD